MSLALLLALLASSARAQSTSDDFDDLNGRSRQFSTEYERHFGSERGASDPIRAAVESAVLLSFGTLWYVSNSSANQADWEFSSLGEKLQPESIRFDNNQFTTNMLLHPISGSGYYGFPRLNRLSVPVSFAYGFVTSALWEYAFEWREKVSINDQIMTPIGGAVIGECFTRLIDYVDSGASSDNWALLAARHTFGLPASLHRWLDVEPRGADNLPPDKLGLSSAYAHDFKLGYGLVHAWGDRGDDATAHALVAEAEVIAMPGFLRPGSFQVLFLEGNFTEMAMRLLFGDQGLEDADVWFRAALLGYYEQHVERRTGWGRAFSISLASGFTNQQRWLLGRRDDIGVLHAAGPALDTWLTTSDMRLHLRLEGSFDFAALRPAAFARFREQQPDGVVNSSLSAHGYDYYVGLSSRLLLVYSYRLLELGLRVGHGVYDSMSGLDRFEEAITRQVSSTDELTEYRLWLGLTPAPLPAQIRLSFETSRHAGATETVAEKRWDRLAAVEALLRF